MKTLYPIDLSRYQRILCADQLFRELKAHEPRFKNPFRNRPRSVTVGFIKIFCFSSHCRAFMEFELNSESIYELKNGNNEHNHVLDEQVPRASKVEKTLGVNYQQNRLYVTQKMVGYYLKYYRCMYVTITKVRNLSMLAFSCSMPTKDIGIFGLALYEKPTKILVGQTVQQFAARKQRHPETIICNHPQLSSFCRQSFPSANLIMADQEISQNYKVRYGFSRLVELVTSETDWERQHRKLVTYVRQCISPAEMKSLFENYKKLCLPFLSPSFVGLSVQLFQPLILEQTSEENIYFTNESCKFLANFPIQITTCFNDTETKDFIEQVGIETKNLLVNVYAELEEPVVRFLARQQNKTFFCDVAPLPSGQFQVKYKSSNPCLVSKRQEKWQCDCGLYLRTGLPCCHLLKILILLEEEIRAHIDPYWLQAREQKAMLRALKVE